MGCISGKTLFDHLTGELKGDRASHVADHLSSCDSCRERLNAMQRQIDTVTEAFSSWGPGEIPERPEFVPAVRSRRSKRAIDERIDGFIPAVRLRPGLIVRALIIVSFFICASISVMMKKGLICRSGVEPHPLLLYEPYLASNKLGDWAEKSLMILIPDEESEELRVIRSSPDKSRIETYVIRLNEFDDS